MAQKGVQLDRETFSCSICLDLLRDPVTIPCGHSYCMICIKSVWDEKQTHSCPQCRQTFTQRPVLVKNTMLAALVEGLKNTGLEAAPADPCFAGAGDVACDFCIGRRVKALKSCLVCLASYCEKHLQPHYTSTTFEKHKLVEPSDKLLENICSRHDEVMKMFCRTDGQCICYLCSMDEHKDHYTVSAAAERSNRQAELEDSRLIIQQGIKDRQKDKKLLQQKVEDISCLADRTLEHNDKIFPQLIRLVEKRHSDVNQQVRSQKETEVSQVKELQKKLEKEIAELKKKDAELGKLSHMEDHNQFLREYASLPALGEATHSSSINVQHPLRYFEDVTAAVSQLQDKLQDILTEKWTNLSHTETEVDVLLPEPEPKTRAEFLKYSRDITVDPNTANRQLLLSKGNREVKFGKLQSYPPHPDRFTEYWQVLSRESLTGRCYWEVEWRDGGLHAAVSYKNIKREGWGKECEFGSNGQSWSLFHDTNNKYSFWYNGIQTPFLAASSSKVGVYLDHSAGVLSFYSVSNNMDLLHTVQTTFTQPLYAGLWLYNFGVTAEFIKLK